MLRFLMALFLLQSNVPYVLFSCYSAKRIVAYSLLMKSGFLLLHPELNDELSKLNETSASFPLFDADCLQLCVSFVYFSFRILKLIFLNQ